MLVSERLLEAAGLTAQGPGQAVQFGGAVSPERGSVHTRAAAPKNLPAPRAASGGLMELPSRLLPILPLSSAPRSLCKVRLGEGSRAVHAA